MKLEERIESLWSLKLRTADIPGDVQSRTFESLKLYCDCVPFRWSLSFRESLVVSERYKTIRSNLSRSDSAYCGTLKQNTRAVQHANEFQRISFIDMKHLLRCTWIQCISRLMYTKEFLNVYTSLKL